MGCSIKERFNRRLERRQARKQLMFSSSSPKEIGASMITGWPKEARVNDLKIELKSASDIMTGQRNTANKIYHESTMNTLISIGRFMLMANTWPLPRCAFQDILVQYVLPEFTTYTLWDYTIILFYYNHGINTTPTWNVI